MKKYDIAQIDKEIELKIATGMIVSNRFLREVKTIYKSNLLDIPYVRTIAEWCIKYFNQYEKAPKKHIQDIYLRKKIKHVINKEQAELISDFLSNISAEYEEAKRFNVDYLLDQTEEYLSEQSLTKLNEEVSTLIERENHLGAQTLIAKYKKIERPKSQGVNPFIGKDAIRDAFEQTSEPLFTFPGALGYMLNEHLVREAFIGIMGKEKGGKTFWLMEIARRALRQGCNVAFFGVGDMLDKQYRMRWLISLAERSNKKKYCGHIKVPHLDCLRNQKDTCHKKERENTEDISSASYQPCKWCARKDWKIFFPTIWYEDRFVEPLDWKDAYRIGKKFNQKLQGNTFKLICYPNDSVNVHQIEDQLDIWEKMDGFVPDVVLIDYADILASLPTSAKEERHRQNDNWKAMRALSQKKHCLVVTATQTDTASYDVKTLKMKHFSEDKRKYGHVTIMLGLNQLEEEKEKGVLRINIIVSREGEFNPNVTVNVLQCLRIGKPYLASYWPKREEE